MFRSKKTPFEGVVEEAKEWIEIASDIEEPARFGVETELSPGEHLDKLFERAETPR